MKSIQTKFLLLILTCVILCSSMIGSAGIHIAKGVVDANSAQIMNLTCQWKAGELDALLSRIEQSVNTVVVFALEQLGDSAAQLSDEAYREDYVRRLEAVAINAANNTEGAIAVYVRFNPALTTSTAGFFWGKTKTSSCFERLPITDLAQYSPSETEYVGWYYIPLENGEPTWMEPYQNQNIDVHMISYVVPIYSSDGQVLGVVGMDIDFTVIQQLVDDAAVYQSGYAFLVSGAGEVLDHPTLSMGTQLGSVNDSLSLVVQELENGANAWQLVPYHWDALSKKLSFQTLKNGMRLAVTAPVAEIDAAKNRLIQLVLIATVGVSLVSILMTVLFTRRLIRPLKALNEAAEKIAAGDLSVSLAHMQHSRDEVGALSKSFQKTVNHLQKYIDYINGLAYRDALTGVKNKTAYQEAEQQLNQRIRQGRPEFAVVVFDINHLKRVNDNYGHDFGDMLIVQACRLICNTFQHSPVYRVGGDEFVAILEGRDFENYPALLEAFDAGMAGYNQNSRPDNQLSVARGIAVFESETDMVCASVFKRADSSMYQNKAVMKAREKAQGSPPQAPE